MIGLYVCIACFIVALLIQFGFIMNLAVRNSKINAWLESAEKSAKAEHKENRKLKGIKSYITPYLCDVDATKVVERRGCNTKFYMNDELVASMPEGSSYSVNKD